MSSLHPAVTYQGDPTSTTNSIMKALVVGLVIWVAYWAATGGIDRIAIADVTTTTSTTVAE